MPASKTKRQVIQERRNAAEPGDTEVVSFRVDPSVVRMFDAMCAMRGKSRGKGFAASIDDHADANIRDALRLGVIPAAAYNRVTKKHQGGGWPGVYRAKADLLEMIFAKCPAWMELLARDAQKPTSDTSGVPVCGDAEAVTLDMKASRIVASDSADRTVQAIIDAVNNRLDIVEARLDRATEGKE